MLHIQRLFIFVVIMFPLLSSILILDHTTQTLPILSPPNEYLESRLSFIVHRFGHSLPSIYEPLCLFMRKLTSVVLLPLFSFSLVSELHVSFLFMSPRPLRAFLILNDYSPCFFFFYRSILLPFVLSLSPLFSLSLTRLQVWVGLPLSRPE